MITSNTPHFQQSNTLDKADWTRPHMLRQVPLQTLGALYVNDKKSQDQQEREERKQQNMFPDGISGYGRSVRLAPGESRNGCLCVYVPLSCNAPLL